ncbi:MAG: RHS repeat domain-containing protein [Nitrospirales bacterium]
MKSVREDDIKQAGMPNRGRGNGELIVGLGFVLLGLFSGVLPDLVVADAGPNEQAVAQLEQQADQPPVQATTPSTTEGEVVSRAIGTATRVLMGTVAPSDHTKATVTTPPSEKLVGGGAFADWRGAGSLLTSSAPTGLTGWEASAKDHGAADPSALTAYAILLPDPGNMWEVTVREATSPVTAHPSMSVTSPPGYVMASGGCRVNWKTGPSAPGNLLTASFPSSATTWECRAKDHAYASPASVTAYVVAIRPRNTATPLPRIQIDQASSAVGASPAVQVRATRTGYVVTGGGAQTIVPPGAAGQLLTQSAPLTDGSNPMPVGWMVRSKDHLTPSPGTVTAYVISLNLGGTGPVAVKPQTQIQKKVPVSAGPTVSGGILEQPPPLVLIPSPRTSTTLAATMGTPHSWHDVKKWYGKFSIALTGTDTSLPGISTTYNHHIEGSFTYSPTDTTNPTRYEFSGVTNSSQDMQAGCTKTKAKAQGPINAVVVLPIIDPKASLNLWIYPDSTYEFGAAASYSGPMTVTDTCTGQTSTGSLLFQTGGTTGIEPLPNSGLILQGHKQRPTSFQNVVLDITWYLSPDPLPPPPSPPPPTSNPPSPPPMASVVDDTVSEPCLKSGSVIACENQSLGEAMDVVGTPFTLHYQSDRVPGRAAANPVAVAHARQLGGWTLSAHHVYDIAKKTLYLGTGVRRNTTELSEVLPGPGGTVRILSVNMGATYEFDASGRHLSTLDVRTGSKRLGFGYDAQGRLITVIDVAGTQVTKIERDSAGNPIAIVNPLGVRTTFTLDAKGYLASITNPAQEKTTFTMTPDGLLVGMKDPKGHAYVYAYDANGRLVKDELLGVGAQRLARVTRPDGSYTVTHTSAENRTTTYTVKPRTGAEETRTVTAPGGYVTTSESKSAGGGKNLQTVRLPDGTQIDTVGHPDPNSFDMTQTVTTPAGLKKVVSASRRVPSSEINETLEINGHKLVRAYDDNAKLLTERTGQFPYRLVFFDAKGRVAREEVRGLAPIFYQYNAQGQLSSIIQGVAQGSEGFYQSPTNTVRMRSLQLKYDNAGLISQVVDPLGRTIDVKRDGAGRVIAAQYASGQQIVNVKYDANGNLIMVSPPVAQALKKLPNLPSVSTPPRGKPTNEAHTFEYQLPDRPSAYRPPSGQPTKYEYDRELQVRRVLPPDGRIIELTYDTAGRVADLKADQIGIAFGYNARTGKIDTINTKGGSGLSYKYDGLLLKSEKWTGPVQGAVQREYDTHFRLKSLQIVPPIPPPPAKKMPPNPSMGLQPPATPSIRVETIPPPNPLLEPVVFSYDALGYLKDAGGFGLKRDSWNGQLQNTVLGDGKGEYWHRDQNLQLGKNSDNPEYCSQTSYWCGYAKVTSKVPNSVPNHVVHDEWAYNQFGEVTSYEAKYRNGEVTSDEAKYRKDLVLADTVLFSESIQRDVLGRVTEKTEKILDPNPPAPVFVLPSGTQEAPCGPVINEIMTGAPVFVELFNSCATPVGVEGWRLTYRTPDKAGAPPTSPDNGTYDILAWLQGTMPPNGYRIYSGSGFSGPHTDSMIGALGADGAVGLKDASGRLRDSVGYGAVPLGGFTEGSPVPKPPPGVSIARVPDGRDTNQNSTDFRIAPLTPGRPTPLPIARPLVTRTYTYTYDKVGRLMEVRDKKDNRLLNRYFYDANGNRIYNTNDESASPTTTGGMHATYDAADHLLQYGRFTYSWSPNGDLQTKTIDHAITRYSYDLLGNLTGVTLPDGKQITYVIDGRSRRIAKLVNGVLTRKWLYQDGLRPIAELDGNNNVVSRFVYATGRNVPDYFFSLYEGGSTYRIITDQLGSPRLVVNVATGAIVQQLEYDEFGKVLLDTRPGFQPFGFAGGLYDTDTGLVRFGARDYDSQVGRWTNRDPIGFAGGDTNLYAYVGNDSVNIVDPYGLWIRGPDFITFNIGFGLAKIPLIGKYLGWSGTFTIDRKGNTYFSYLGSGAGIPTKPAVALEPPVSLTCTANWLNQGNEPSSAELRNFLTEHGVSFSGGAGPMGSLTWSPGNGTATGIGLSTPQAGVSYGYSELGENVWFDW